MPLGNLLATAGHAASRLAVSTLQLFHCPLAAVMRLILCLQSRLLALGQTSLKQLRLGQMVSQ